MTVGKRLKEERKRLRLTQQEMADACGISKWAQLYFEKDQNMPGGAYLLAAHARGVDIMYVLLEQRVELDPSEAALVAAFRAASPEVRTAMLSDIGSARAGTEKVAPVVTFNDNSHVSQMLNTTGAIDQRNMQIKMGGRKKKKS
ncbi:transcriptional regulator [Xanthomonas citri pv. fuscans]|uniref:helix-turn-helix domain-containing protein n=1 Tax=Xanthomonas citri TaxID=346 RepID=UPI000538AC35|nr:transcriptional regulator [Xanthomonas citri]KGT55757.1 transcriptional regulator [Xanthomonas citri pv. fuscans]